MPKEPTAGDVMSEGVIAIDQSATVQEAARKMRDEGIRSLVVVDESEAVGIIVGRDIVYQVVSQGVDPAETLVGDVMTDSLVTAAEQDDIEEIARAMVENDISRVPVLRGEDLVGMVTQSNLMRTWPSYLDLLEEETHAYGAAEEVAEDVAETSQRETHTGLCDSCENYSEQLVDVDGERLCPDCVEGEL